MPQNRNRYRISNALGEEVAALEPAPRVVKLVSDEPDKDGEVYSNNKADSLWKKWLSNLQAYVSGLTLVLSDFTAPNMTTAERDALTAVNGMIIYNTTTNVFNFYENGAWVTK